MQLQTNSLTALLSVLSANSQWKKDNDHSMSMSCYGDWLACQSLLLSDMNLILVIT